MTTLIDYTRFTSKEDGKVYYNEPEHKGNMANITDCDVKRYEADKRCCVVYCLCCHLGSCNRLVFSKNMR
jgi:hypothetical protein